MKKLDGFTLLETLVGLFLLSFALLGFYSASITALRQSRGSAYFQQAYIHAVSMSDYLRAHQGNDANYLKDWNNSIQANLPGGSGEVTGMFPHYQINIYWGGPLRRCEENHLGITGCIILKVNLQNPHAA